MEYTVLGRTGLRVSRVGCGGGALGFLLEGPMRTLLQAAMVFCLMNRDIANIVPGVKNVAEMEELVGCVALPPIPPQHLTRLRELYARGFQG